MTETLVRPEVYPSLFSDEGDNAEDCMLRAYLEIINSSNEEAKLLALDSFIKKYSVTGQISPNGNDVLCGACLMAGMLKTYIKRNRQSLFRTSEQSIIQLAVDSPEACRDDITRGEFQEMLQK